MNTLNNIVLELLSTYQGGEIYFDKLDEALRQEKHLPIILELFAPLKDKNIIVSGKFGSYILSLYEAKLIDINSLIYVNGGLRDGHISKVVIKNYKTDSDYIFVDDSYYLGRTQHKIEVFLQSFNNNLIATHVVYDGSFELNKNVHSLFRYHK